MSIAAAIMRLAALGLTEVQARVVGEVITEIQVASEAAIESRRASDRERKRLKRLRTSADIQGQARTSEDVSDAKPRVRAFSIGEEEVITSSLRSEAAVAAPANRIFENARQELWGAGKELLGELGIGPSKAGTMIGRWLKETGDDAAGVLDAIRRAREHKPVDPVAWIVMALPTRRRSANGHHAKPPSALQTLIDIENGNLKPPDDNPSQPFAAGSGPIIEGRAITLGERDDPGWFPQA